MDTINDRLEYILSKFFKSKTEAAAFFGVTRGHISNVTTGNKPVRGDFLEKVAESLPMVNIDWLYHGRGDMYFRATVEGDYTEATVDLVHGVGEPPASYLPEVSGEKKDVSDAEVIARIMSRLIGDLEALQARVSVLEGAGKEKSL